MQMTEIFDKLKRLEVVLAKKYEIEAKKEELPKTLYGSEESLDKFKKEFIEKNEEYEAEKEKLSKIKVELEETLRHREESEKQMDNITTHREYELLDKQINEDRIKEENLRKDMQKLEKIVSELDDIIKGKELLISSTESDVNEAKESMNQEMNAYDAELNKLLEEEKECNEGLDQETIIKFQRIIKRNHKGIVSVNGNVCDGCHMILPAQFANEVHAGEKILFCPYCSRILYYEETGNEDSEYFSLDNAGSLADFDDVDVFSEDGESLTDYEE